MVWTDLEKKRAYDREYGRAKQVTYGVRLMSDSLIAQAVEKIKAEGTPPGTYLRRALVEKLIRDGYLSEDQNDNQG